MMAAWLWELSGEEPFSCYQQTGGLPQRWVDLVIRHPEPIYRSGRPARHVSPALVVTRWAGDRRASSGPARRALPDRSPAHLSLVPSLLSDDLLAQHQTGLTDVHSIRADGQVRHLLLVFPTERAA